MISLGSAYGEILIGTDKAEKDTRSLAETMRSVGTGLSLAISTPLIAVAGAGLKAAAGFEESMNLIQTVGSATAEQMQNVQAQALQLGKDTSFSAGEAAEGFLELTKAGFSIESSMAAIGGVMNLAAAGNLSVASAAEIASNAINSFGLPASDAVRIADLLAAGANASSVEVTDLSDSLKMSGSVLGGYGQSLDDTTTALALMGNQGIKGSDAGTSLKQMFISLAAPTDKARNLMKNLGISIYDAQGNMLEMPDILQNLQDGFSGMTEEQINAAKATLFGSDGIRAANVLLSEGEAGWNEMSRAVRKGGAAAEVAASRQKGFNGAMEYFKGTMESLLIEVLLPFLDTLSGGLRWIADLVALFTQLPRPVQYAALAFLAVLAAIGPVLLALSGVATVLGLLLSPIGLIGVAIAALAAAWVSNWGDIQGEAQAAWDYIKPIFDSIAGWLQNTAGQALEWLRAKWNEVWPGLQSAVSGMWSIIEPIFISIRDWVKTKIGEGIIALQSAWETTWTGIQEATQSAWTAIAPYLQSAVSWAKTNLPNALPTLQTAWTTAWTAIRTATINAWEAIAPYLQSALDWVEVNLPKALPALQIAWTNTWTAIRTAVNQAWAAIEPKLIQIETFMSEDYPSAVETANDRSGESLGQMQQKNNAVIQAIQAAWQTLIDWFEPIVVRFVAAFQNMAAGFAELGPKFQAVWEQIQPVIRYIEVAFGGLLLVIGIVVAGIAALFLNLATAIMSGVVPIIGGIADLISGVFESISVGWKGTVDLVGALISGDWRGAWNAAGETVRATSMLISAIWAGVWGVVYGILTIIGSFVKSVLEDMGVNVDANMQVIKTSWDTTWSGALGMLRSVVAGWIALFTTVRQWLVWTLPNAVKSLQEKFSETWTAIKSFLIDTILAPIISTLEAISTFLTETLPNAAKEFKNFLGNLRLPNPFEGLLSAISSVLSGLKSIWDFLQKISGFKDWNPLATSTPPPKDNNPNNPPPDEPTTPISEPVSGSSVRDLVQAIASAANGLAPVMTAGAQLAGAGGINVNVNIDAGGISSGVDVEAMAYRVANRTVEEIRRRLR